MGPPPKGRGETPPPKGRGGGLSPRPKAGGYLPVCLCGKYIIECLSYFAFGIEVLKRYGNMYIYCFIVLPQHPITKHTIATS